MTRKKLFGVFGLLCGEKDLDHGIQGPGGKSFSMYSECSVVKKRLTTENTDDTEKAFWCIWC